MVQSELILYIIKLSLGGIAAFLAIMLWSKTRDAAWMSLVAGTVIHYAGVVYNMLIDFGVVFRGDIYVLGLSLSSLLFTALPLIFFIIAFILMLHRSR